MDFNVVVDEALTALATGGSPSPHNGKSILGLLNDFEDKAWRYTKFHNFVWDNIAETSLSARERASLAECSASKLSACATKLRLTDGDADPGRGSEIAEIVLYAVMKHHYGALPVVPKIFYKQNKNDYAKGADSVHVVLAKQLDDFSLWFGESKFYSDIEDARLDTVIASVADSLSTEKIRKENSIITGLTDLDELVTDTSLRSRIRAVLDGRRSIDSLKSRLNIPILLLYECAITAKSTSFSLAYTDEIKKYIHARAESYFHRQDKKLLTLPGYSELRFHLIVFPVPSKKTVVQNFLKLANAFKAS